MLAAEKETSAFKMPVSLAPEDTSPPRQFFFAPEDPAAVKGIFKF